MNDKPAQTATTQTFPVGLIPQTGMPPVYHPRSAELAYDVLLNNSRFLFNPFGPQKLILTRPNKHW